MCPSPRGFRILPASAGPWKSPTELSEPLGKGMICPACRAIALTPVPYEGVIVEACDACGGYWLDGERLRHIIHARQVHFGRANCELIARQPRSPGIPAGEVERQLSCPRCSCAMAVLNYAQDSGIIINRCPSCGGLWFDRGELDKVQMLVEGIADSLAEDT